jgi:peptidoglycan/LPS O-acetylase OafA/YrhL
MASKAAYFLFFGILLVNLYQKRYGKKGERKRFATLYLGFAAFCVFIAAGAITHSRRIFSHEIPDTLIFAAIGALAYAVYRMRDKTLPFRVRCRGCGTKLSAEQAFFLDSNLCRECEAKNG